jgi:hypothetical protein
LIASTLYGLLMFQVPNLMSFFQCLDRTNESVLVRGTLKHFFTIKVFTVRVCQPHAQVPSWRTTPCRLSAIAYSMYSQLPSVPGGLPFIRNTRTRNTVMTRDPPNMDNDPFNTDKNRL